MGLDDKFLKKNPDAVPAGENVLGVLIAEPKGGAWRRGMQSAGVIASTVASVAESRQGQGAAEGEAASWPEAPAYWMVLTDKQLHVFGGRMGSTALEGGSAHYPFDRIASIDIDKKMMISKMNVSFTDGTGVELGLAKQKIKPFMEAVEARFPAR